MRGSEAVMERGRNFLLFYVRKEVGIAFVRTPVKRNKEVALRAASQS